MKYALIILGVKYFMFPPYLPCFVFLGQLDEDDTLHTHTHTHINVKVKVSQSCLTLCDLMEDTVHGILQARILEWVAFPFSRGSSQPRD